MKRLIFFLLLPIFLFGNENFYYYKGKKVYLTPLESKTVRTNSVDKILYFSNNRGKKIGVNHTFLARLHPNIMIIDIEKKYGVKFLKQITPKIAKFQGNSPQEALAISNKMVEDNVVVYAHPNFIVEKEFR